MRRFKIFMLAALFTSFLVSCSKDNDDVMPGNATIQGIWQGYYGYNSQAPVHYFSFEIKDGGTIVEYNSSSTKKATGTWALSGSDFSATLKYILSGNEYKVDAKFNSNTGRLEGTWGYSSSTSGGKWYMTK